METGGLVLGSSSADGGVRRAGSRGSCGWGGAARKRLGGWAGGGAGQIQAAGALRWLVVDSFVVVVSRALLLLLLLLPARPPAVLLAGLLLSVTGALCTRLMTTGTRTASGLPRTSEYLV